MSGMPTEAKFSPHSALLILSIWLKYHAANRGPGMYFCAFIYAAPVAMCYASYE